MYSWNSRCNWLSSIVQLGAGGRALSTLKMFALMVILYGVSCPSTAIAGPTYQWQVFVWGPRIDEMVYGPDNGKQWSGEWEGHLGTFQCSDQTLVYGDFVWWDMGFGESPYPPGPWRYIGTVTYYTSHHVTGTYFWWYDEGYEGDFNHLHTTELNFTQEYTWTEPHPLWLTNRPIPSPSAAFLCSIGASIVGWLHRRKTI